MMARPTPSQIVAAIEDLFPPVKDGKAIALMAGHGTRLRGIVGLLDKLPGDLLILTDKEHADVLLSKGAIEEMLENWKAGKPGGVPDVRYNQDAITILYRALKKCPDRLPPPAHADLTFVQDQDLRESIRADISSAYRALAAMDWKPATVMAGAAIEALLHWRLGQVPILEREAVQSAPSAKGKKKELNDYVLSNYIEVASDLRLLKKETATAASLAKDFRNLVHPGRSIRLSASCTRGTAHMAIGAMEEIIEALS